MSSLAHEGNPKEDEIIITAGSVLSTAQLDVDFLFLGQGENIPILEEITPYIAESSHSDKYLYSIDPDTNKRTFQFGNDCHPFSQTTTQLIYSRDIDSATFLPARGYVLEYSAKDFIAMYGFITQVCSSNWWELTEATGPGTSAPTASWSSHTGQKWINKDWNTYRNHWIGTSGIGSGNPATTGTYRVYQYMQATIANGSLGIVNYPISGVAVGVSPESTFTSFTGIVGVIDFYQQLLIVMSYYKQPLSGFGTILSATTAAGYPSVAADTIVTAFLSYAKSVTHAVPKPTGPKLTDTENWAVRFSFGDVVSDVDISGIIPPYIGNYMRTALVNIASSASHAPTIEDSIIWKEPFSYFSFDGSNTNYDVYVSRFG